MSNKNNQVPKMSRLSACVLLGLSSLGAIVSCGGGSSDSAPQSGSTVANVIAPKALVSCVDVNRNWQCDDGDAARTASAVGAQGLAAKSKEYVLLESRDSNNQRTRLLISEAGSDTVNGLSTLRTILVANGKTAAEIALLESTLSGAFGTELDALLIAGFTEALKSNVLSIAGLTQFSLAAANQKTARPTLAAYAPTIGAGTTDVTWGSNEASSVRRQLSVQNSTVLNNSETNRLYLFDAGLPTVSSREIDLVPPPLPALANYPTAVRRVVAAIDKTLSIMIDTASAATGFYSPPVATPPVPLEPGKGITGIQLVDGGRSAFVLLNMLSGKYTNKECASTADGNEGLFKISLTDTASYRGLKQAPACVHSGFSLLTADTLGTRAVAWDATEKMLWVLDGTTLQKQLRIDVAFEANNPPQSMAITPGGGYLAIAATGRVTLIDLNTGRLVTQLNGDWKTATQMGFANGARRLLIASENQVFSVSLDDSLKLLGTSAAAITPAGSTIRALTVAPDGDSYIAASDAQVSWRTVANNAALGASNLPDGLSVQHAALAGKRLVVLARGNQDKQFKLIRMLVDLPATPL